MLRVRADVIDRLANEAGEVSIARARVEGELRALKANLLELTGSVIRLRSQVREIEIQVHTPRVAGPVVIRGEAAAQGAEISRLVPPKLEATMPIGSRRIIEV